MTPEMHVTMALYGPPKSGKSWAAATFPNPVFIAAAPERGWTALNAHDNWPNITILPVPLVPGQEQICGDPQAAPPPDYAVVRDNAPRQPIVDMENIILRRIREEHAQRGWRTVVVDTMSIYADMVVSQLSDYGRIDMWGSGGGNWTIVQQHMLNMINALQGLPLHVVWLFHVRERKTGEIVLSQEPAIVGSNWAKVFAPVCRLIGYLKKDETLNSENGAVETTRRLLLKCPSNFNPPFVAGGNFEHLFGGTDWCLAPTWESLSKRLHGTFKTE